MQCFEHEQFEVSIGCFEVVSPQIRLLYAFEHLRRIFVE